VLESRWRQEPTPARTSRSPPPPSCRRQAQPIGWGAMHCFVWGWDRLRGVWLNGTVAQNAREK